MVNVRDLGGIKHTFKLLVFPEPRLFQCANAEAKKVIHILLYKDFVFTYITFSRLGWMPSNEPRPIPKRSMSLVAPPRRPIPQSEPLIVQSNEVWVSDCLKITKKITSRRHTSQVARRQRRRFGSRVFYEATKLLRYLNFRAFGFVLFAKINVDPFNSWLLPKLASFCKQNIDDVPLL